MATWTTSTACARPRASADGVIHLAFKHEGGMRTGSFMDAVEADRGVPSRRWARHWPTPTPAPASASSSASGTLMLALGGITGRAGTEADFAPSGPRVDTENAW